MDLVRADEYLASQEQSSERTDEQVVQASEECPSCADVNAENAKNEISYEASPSMQTFDVSDTVNNDLGTAAMLTVAAVTSFSDTIQVRALDSSGLVNQLEKITGQDQYIAMNEVILNDPKLSPQEKMNLKHQNDVWQDERIEKNSKTVASLQSENAKNSRTTTTSWILPMCCIGICGGLFVLSLTPGGRVLVTSIIKLVPHVKI